MPVFSPGTPVATADAVIDVEGLAPGTHRFRLEVEDESGNRSAPDERVVVVRPAVPVVTGFRPGFGAWGDEVVVVGTGFDAVPQKNEVFFNGTRTDVSSGAATELRARVPQPATTGPVLVRNAGGEATSPRPFIIPVAFGLKPGGPAPVDLAAEPRRGEIWVVHGTAGADVGAVSVLALKTRELVATIPVQRGAREIAIAPPVDRQAAVVTNGLASTASVIDVASRQVRLHVRVEPNPRGVAFRPDGRIAYVVCQGERSDTPGMVLAIDVTDSPRVVARVEVGRAPERVVFAPDGKLAFVNDTADGTVSVIEADAHRLVNRVRVGRSPDSKPSEVAVSPATFPLFTANPGTRTASIVQSNFVARDLDAGFAAAAAAIDAHSGQGWLAGPDEKLVVVAALGDGSTRKQRGAGAGDGPKSIVVADEGRGVFVANPEAGAVSVYQPKTLELLAVVPVPEFPTRGVTAAGGGLACFICAKGNALVVIEVGSVLP